MQDSIGISEYKTVAQKSEIEIVISKSRFIGRCFPCVNEDEALSTLDSIRKKHWDASHNCFAYSIGSRGERARFSDDGEPSGTAGAPMMDALKNIGVTDLICVITRYFGGILLGAGGLVRAYSRCCSEAVKAASIVTMLPSELCSFELPYSTWAKISDMFYKCGVIESTDFTDLVRVKVWVATKQRSEFFHEITDRTDGAINGVVLKSGYMPIKEIK